MQIPEQTAAEGHYPDMDGDAVPAIGSFWTHSNGDTYEVTGYADMFSRSHQKTPPRVIYRSGKTGRVWSRVLSDWYRAMKPAARAALATTKATAPVAWQPIETAPKGEVVLVYTPPQPDDWPDQVRIDFDCIGPDYEGWTAHGECYEHFMAVGGSGAAGPDVVCVGPSESAPYTHWMPIPAAPGSAPPPVEAIGEPVGYERLLRILNEVPQDVLDQATNDAINKLRKEKFAPRVTEGMISHQEAMAAEAVDVHNRLSEIHRQLDNLTPATSSSQDAPRAEPAGLSDAHLPVWWDRFILNVCEIPDRNSPEGEPDAMIATAAELANCALSAMETCAPAAAPAALTRAAVLKMAWEVFGNRLHPEKMANDITAALAASAPGAKGEK